MNTVIVADKNIPFIGSMYHDMAEVCLTGGHNITPSVVRDADILLVRSVTIIGTATSGFDHVDTDYLASKGIRFAYAPGSNSNSVAEYIVAALLVLSSRLKFDLRKTTLGVVGVGNVGSKVVRKAAALGMRVLQNDPPLQRAGRGPQFVHLDELMEADIITLHVPLTHDGIDATHYLFDERRISAMKKSSILINSSRGPVVKTDALRKALKTGHLRTAVLDVWENEPRIDEDILEMIEIGTPHIAGYSVEGKTNGAVSLYHDVCSFLGMKHSWSMEGKLPGPEFPVIQLSDPGKDDVGTLSDIVQKCYDISGDDSNMRRVAVVKPEEKKEYFIKLRADYPVRREFASTDINISESQTRLIELFKNVGFSVNGKTIK
jgi:erythronate-4-phosphate dehydrogenase